MKTDFSTRSTRRELMDDPSIDEGELAKTLDDLGVVNAVLGGHRTSVAGLEELVGTHRRSLTVLDIGAGGGDLIRRLCRWAQRRGIDFYGKGIDLSPKAVRHARRRSRFYCNAEFECRDLFELPEEPVFDVVHASLLLHHLSDEEAVEGLRIMYAASRSGVVINDLHRHPVGYYGARTILPVLSRNRLVRHDGPLSILRAFRREELQQLVERAGLPPAKIRWRPMFRWQCIIERGR